MGCFDDTHGDESAQYPCVAKGLYRRDTPLSIPFRVTLRKDYRDMGGMTAQAPPPWLEDLATADTSRIFDATGLI
jgi:hypothetical protein